MKFLVYLTILSSILGQLAKLPLAAGNFYPVDFLVIVTVTVWILVRLVSRDYGFKLPVYSFFLFFFLFWALVTLVNGSSEVTRAEFWLGSFYYLRFVFYSAFSLVIYDLGCRDKKFSPGLLRVLVLCGFLAALAGFLQLAIYPDLKELAKEFGYDPHKNRLVSTFLDPNFTGAYLVLVLVLLFSKKLNFSSLLLGLILLTALILTFSRSAWIMFSVVILLYGILKSPKLLILSFLVFLAAYLVVPRVQTRISGITDPDDSAKLRLVSWNRALEVAQENLWLGVGFNLYRPAQERFGFFGPVSSWAVVSGGHAGAGSDSSLLLVLATTGFIGLSLYLLLSGQLFVKALKNIGNPASLALALSLFGLIFESQFVNSLFYPPILLWLWTLVGLANRQP